VEGHGKGAAQGTSAAPLRTGGPVRGAVVNPSAAGQWELRGSMAPLSPPPEGAQKEI